GERWARPVRGARAASRRRAKSKRWPRFPQGLAGRILRRPPSGTRRRRAMMPPMSEPEAPMVHEGLRAEDLREIWSLAHPDEREEGFRSLSFAEAQALFLSLDPRPQR